MSISYEGGGLRKKGGLGFHIGQSHETRWAGTLG